MILNTTNSLKHLQICSSLLSHISAIVLSDFSHMKLQHLRLAFCDEANLAALSPPSSPTSLNINIKRPRPVEPKQAFTNVDTMIDIASSLGLRSFDSPKASKSTEVQNHDFSPSGGTRWNPTRDQIRALEDLYRGGMRTPNAREIETITAELGKHGRIEGKNVFYWFQNHKARERQRQKRTAALLALDGDPFLSLFCPAKGEKEQGSGKRKCRSWEDGELSADEGDGTLELFPLRPERGEEK